ncbi:transcriptional regulator, TetR family [Lachnospiraceae bacterium G41]|nr:transcriptional regulator, TetR family [Lachnospiraceae bacterium G41]
MIKDENDYEKRKKLIEAGKKEFLEKGYNKASLRKICSDAGVTTGALYFFFENKEDLYSSIVNPPLMELKKMVIEHFKEDQAFLSNMDSLDLGNLDHSDIADMLVDHVYKNYDSFILLLSGSKEDALENGIDEFVEILEQSTIAMVSGSKFYTYDPFMTHWMAHTTVDSMVHVIKHEKDVNVAKKRIQSIMNYLVIGWVKLVMVPIDGDKSKKKKNNN